MENEAIRGIRWTMLGYGGTRLWSLITNLVLARLLVPSDFGLIAFSSLLISAVVLVGSLGLGSAIVIRQDLRRSELRTALTLLIGAFLLCAIVIAAISPVATDLLNNSRATDVLRALAIPVLFGGVTWFYGSVMQRELKFSRQFLCLAGQVVVIAGTAIPLAASGAGVWSLVIGQIAGAVACTALLVALAPYRLRLGWDRATARTLLGTGWGFVLQGGFSFVEQNADYAVVGTKLGSQQLGLYSLAYRIGEVPSNFIVEPIAQATFPGFARMRERSEDVAGSFLTTLRLSAFCAFPLGLIVAGAADPLVETILGPKWTGMIELLRILGIWGSVRILQATTGWFVNSMGFASRVGSSYARMLMVSIPLLVLAASLWETEGVAWVMVGSMMTMSAIVATIADTQLGIPVRRQWEAVRGSVLAAIPAGLFAAAAAAVLSEAPPGFTLLVSLACAFATYLSAIRLLEPELLREARRQLNRLRSAP